MFIIGARIVDNIKATVKDYISVDRPEGFIITGYDNLDILKLLPDNTVDMIYGDILYFTNKKWEKNGWEFDDRFDSMWHFLFFNAERFVELKRVMRTRNYQIIDDILHEDGKVCTYKPRRDKILEDYSSKGKRKKLEKGVEIGSSIFTHLDYRANSEVKTYLLDPLFGEGKSALDWSDVQSIMMTKIGKKVHTPVSIPAVEISQGPDIVLDSWGGSHSTAVAAYLTGRRFISIELNKSEQLFLDEIDGKDFGSERYDV